MHPQPIVPTLGPQELTYWPFYAWPITVELRGSRGNQTYLIRTGPTPRPRGRSALLAQPRPLSGRASPPLPGGLHISPTLHG